MKKIPLLILAIILFSQTSCVEELEPTNIDTTKEPTFIDSDVLSLTETSKAILNTPQIAKTEVSENNNCFAEEDLHVETNLLSEIPGNLILESESEPFVFNSYENQIEKLQEKSYGYAFSPDRTKYSYIIDANDSPTGKWLVTVNIFGQKSKIPLPKKLETAFYWLDNERLVFDIYTPIEANTISPVVIFNPYTGEVSELPSNYPNLESANDKAWQLFYGADMIFDPSLRYVAYLETPKSGGKNFVLWDRSKETVVSRLPNKRNFLITPIWSRDGSKVYFPNTYFDIESQKEYSEWFQIDTVGNITQLTQFKDLDDKPLIATSSLSPDGSKIVYWWQYHQGFDFSPYTLSVLDLDTLKITNLCINPPSKAPTDPIWSPDSSFIAIWNIMNTPESNDTELIIISLKEEWQGILFSNTRVLGWLKAPEK